MAAVVGGVAALDGVGVVLAGDTRGLISADTTALIDSWSHIILNLKLSV